MRVTRFVCVDIGADMCGGAENVHAKYGESEEGTTYGAWTIGIADKDGGVSFDEIARPQIPTREGRGSFFNTPAVRRWVWREKGRMKIQRRKARIMRGFPFTSG